MALCAPGTSLIGRSMIACSVQYNFEMCDALAVDGWTVIFSTVLSPLLAVPNVTAHPSYHQWLLCQLYMIRCGTIIAFAL